MKDIDKNIYLALNIIEKNGYEGYLVGGAVRNHFLGIKITDYDITTSARPETIKNIFKNYPLYTIGEKHGTVVVTINGTKIDITTYRSDVKYIDHRHPSEVKFSDDLKEDLIRRDFTINAMCIDKDDKFIDEYGGIDDLNNKLIRAIGEPKTRFYEDGLRILRALRFKAKLNFEIEEKTDAAIRECKDLLKYISAERKKEELLQILATKNRYEVINNYLEVFNTFVPFNKIDKKIDEFSNEYFALSYLLSKTNNYNLKELKFSRHEINLINALIEATNTNIDNDYDFIVLCSDPLKDSILSYIGELYSIQLIKRYKELELYIVNKNNLKLNGGDLIKLGYQKEDISKTQDELIYQIRNKKLVNKKDAILKYLESK